MGSRGYHHLLCRGHGAGRRVWREVTNSNGLQGHMQGAGVGFELAVGPEFIHLPDRRNTIVLAVQGVMISSPIYLNAVGWTKVLSRVLVQLQSAPLSHVVPGLEESPGYLVPGGEM